MRKARTAEAAAAIGVSASTLQKWAQQGRVPCSTTAGGHRRFDVDELLRTIRADAPPPTLADLRRQRAQIRRIAKRYGLDRVRVFGSVARGEARPGSDVDLLVDAAPGCSLLDVMAAEIDLEALLGARVQIVTSGDHAALASAFADAIEL